MQAIILAAGMGKRLGEHTKDNTKCMVKVNGVCLIDRMLMQLATHNISRVIIVVGYKKDELIQHIGNKYNDLFKIEYVHNDIYDKTNNIYSLALAKNFMLEEDTLLLESDLIFDDKVLDLIIDNPLPNLALVAKYETWMDGTMVRISEDNDILNFIPKKSFRYSDIDLYYKTCNIYKFSKEFSSTQYVPFLEAYSKAMGDNEYYEQVLRVLTALDRSDLKALPIKEKWYEIDDVQDLDIAETMFSSNDELLDKYYRRYGGYWRFPQLKDYCYLVNPYYPSKRMKDEMRANFDVLLSEYPSGMGVNSALAGECWGIKQEYIIPGNGAAELIKVFMESLEGKVGVVRPTFEEYPNRLLDEQVVTLVPQDEEFRYGADEMIEYFSKNPIETLLLINPDNPSGNFIPMDGVHKLAQWCEENGIQFVLDESFVDFSVGFENNTFLDNDLLEKYPHMCVMKSISKSYGVPGLRLGIFCSADTALIARMKKQVSIWNINSFAQFFMQIYPKYREDYRVACEQFIQAREDFEVELKKIPFIKVMPSQANYFFLEVLPPYQPKELCATLLRKYNILASACLAKKGIEPNRYMRIAVRNHGDNNRLIEALKELAP